MKVIESDIIAKQNSQEVIIEGLTQKAKNDISGSIVNALYFKEFLDTIRQYFIKIDTLLEDKSSDKNNNTSNKKENNLSDINPFKDDKNIGSLFLPESEKEKTDTSTTLQKLSDIPKLFGAPAAAIINFLKESFADIKDVIKNLFTNFKESFKSNILQFFPKSRNNTAGKDSSNGSSNNEALEKIKGIFTGMGDSFKSLAIGLVAIAGAIVLFSIIPPEILAAVGVTLLGIGAMIFGIVKLSDLIEAHQANEKIESVKASILNISKGLLFIAGAIVVTSLAIIAFGLENVMLGIVTLISAAGLSVLLFTGLSKLVELAQVSETMPQVTKAFEDLSKGLVYIGLSIVVASIAGRLVTSDNIASISIILLSSIGILFLFSFISTKLIKPDTSDSIKAVGEAMKNASMSLIIISAAIIAASIAGEVIVSMPNAAIGISLVLGTAIGILIAFGVMATVANSENLEKINNVSKAFTSIAIALAIIAGVFIIISLVELDFKSIGLFIGSSLLLISGMSAIIFLLGKLPISKILTGTVILGLILITIGAMVFLFSKVKELGDFVEIAGLAGGILLMVGSISVIGLALAGLGMLTSLLIPISLGVVVLSTISLAIFAIAKIISVISKAIPGESKETIEKFNSLTNIIFSLVLISNALVFLGFSATTLAIIMPIAIGTLYLLSFAIKKFILPIINSFNEVNISEEAIFKINSIAYIISNLQQIGFALLSLAPIGLLLSVAWLFILPTINYILIASSIIQKFNNISLPSSDELNEKFNSIKTFIKSSSSVFDEYSLLAGGIRSLKFFAIMSELSKTSLLVTKISSISEKLNNIQLSTGVNKLSEDINAIHFTQETAKKLSGIFYNINKAFSALTPGLSLKGGFTLLNTITKINFIANAFERLTNLTNPIREFTAAIQEMAAATRSLDIQEIDIKEKGISEISKLKGNGLNSAFNERLDNQQINSNNEEYNEKLDQIINLLNSIRESSGIGAKYLSANA